MSLGVVPGSAFSGEPVLKLKDVVKSYKTRDGRVHALDGLDLSVAKGAIQGVIGFSGAGKSTLVRCLTALERPDGGQVSINGVDLAKLGERS